MPLRGFSGPVRELPAPHGPLAFVSGLDPCEKHGRLKSHVVGGLEVDLDGLSRRDSQVPGGRRDLDSGRQVGRASTV